MNDELQISRESKEEIYCLLIEQIKALLENETDCIANLANVAAAMKQAFDFLWVGFYRAQGDELVLGPFQGPVACTRIAKGAGVCGKAWAENRSILVPNVDDFPGHIACSSLSKSELVVPIYISGGELAWILDIDSAKYNGVDAIDQKYVEVIASIMACISPAFAPSKKLNMR